MARPPGTEVDTLIFQYEHESQRPRADEALFMLRKIGSIVKPIMRQRMWRVGTLAEFYPTQANLLGLNINRGQKINLRLRHAGDANQFLPFEQVVDTMLHELCHNVIGPHNAQFHALWDQLRDEHEALLRKGYTGEGFLGRGQQLGGQRLPLHEASRLARQAAERRRQLNKGSGQRLGGTGIMRGQDARSVIADAVERRIRIERGCVSGTDAGERIAQDEAIKIEKVTTTQAEPDDVNEATMMQAYIDLIQEEERERFGGYYSPPSAENPAGPRGKNTEPNKAKSLMQQQRQIEEEILKEKQSNSIEPAQSMPRTPSSSSSRTVSPMPRPQPEKQQPVEEALKTWTCEVCTLINPLIYLTCDACAVERPTYISRSLEAAESSPPPIPHSTRPSTSANSKITTRKETPNALKPKSSAYESISRFEAERASKIASKPLGWTCKGCGNFMEMEWWTCASCGRMKDNS